MAKRGHQEEISGASNLVADASIAADLPYSKRTRKQSRKALENASQSYLHQVPTFSSTVLLPAPAPSPSPAPAPTESPAESQKELILHQQSSKRATKEQWEINFDSAQNKAEKLRILVDHIGSVRPFPQKLSIPTPLYSGLPFAEIPYSDPLDLFHRFIPSEAFQAIANHTNQYTCDDQYRDLDEKTHWEEVIQADIGGYFGAILLLGVQPGGRDIDYYWSTDDNQPEWPISQYISRLRFKQITRYFKVNAPRGLSNSK
jgi:Transposase IS4